MVSEPGGWVWSSYSATADETVALPWLAVDALRRHFGAKRSVARRPNRRFVREGVGPSGLADALENAGL
jgi:hypothetical protein